MDQLRNNAKDKDGDQLNAIWNTDTDFPLIKTKEYHTIIYKVFDL